MKAIETRYAGCRFRSRLEARWAVFFDSLGLQWEYEKEGFDLDGIRYLPDFFIDFGKGDGVFVEIKGKSPTSDEVKKCRALSVYYPTYLFPGAIEPPNINTKPWGGSWAMCFPKITGVGKDMELIQAVLQTDIAEWHSGSLTVIDPRPYCWHQRKDDSFILWPVPANDFRRINPASGAIEVVDPLKVGLKFIDSPALLKAYNAARSARFEFGEKGN